jgi:hypothetical protein
MAAIAAPPASLAPATSSVPAPPDPPVPSSPDGPSPLRPRFRRLVVFTGRIA